MSSNDVYFCDFKWNKKIYSLEVNLHADHPSSTDIRSEIRKVILRAMNDVDFTSAPLKTLDVNIKSGTIEYSFSDSNRPIRRVIIKDGFKNEEAAKSAIHLSSLKVIKSTEGVLPERNRKISEIQASLLKAWPAAVPVISFFWNFAIYPLSGLIKLINPGKVYDTVSLSLKEDPHCRLALEDALEDVAELFDDTDPSKIAFRKGIDTAKAWRRDPKAKTDIASNLAGDVLNLPAQGSQMVVLPGGYWKDKETFEPILWSFQREQDGRISLLKMAYGQEEGQTPQKYSFPAAEQEKIALLISNLLEMSSQ